MESSTLVEGGGILGLPFRSPTMLGLSLTQGCAVYTQYFFLTWLPSYLENVKHLTVLKSGLFTAIPAAIAVVCCIMFGSISDRWLKQYGVASGRRRYVVVIAMVGAAVVLFAPFVNNIWLILGLVTRAAPLDRPVDGDIDEYHVDRGSAAIAEGRSQGDGHSDDRRQHLWHPGPDCHRLHHLDVRRL